MGENLLCAGNTTRLTHSHFLSSKEI